jgi:hypothetical protein
MISITISADQIQGAPADVRRWIEGEVRVALGLQGPTASAQQGGEGLAVCSAEEVAAILATIRSVVPAVNVFFELGHQGVSCGQGELEAYRLTDLLQRTRLRTVDQVVMCLDMINEALQHIRRLPKVSLYGLDDHGHCFVAAETRQSIGNLWKQLVDSDRMLAESRPPSDYSGDRQQAQSNELATPAPNTVNAN